MTACQIMDGNQAAAYVSYAFTQLAALYPITPSSPMGELVDQWAQANRPNLFGAPVKVVNMQSEAGAAGALHGALKAGVFASTYTSSQGLLLMLPNLYKIAGELLPTVINVAARTVATSALSIFGDHSDVMAVRQSGVCMLAESSVQEVMDLSAVAHLASISGSLPFVNFFDGFRTSHESQRVRPLAYADLKALIDADSWHRFQNRAMHPNHPYLSGTTQNSDIHFQARESVNPFYQQLPGHVQRAMQAINQLQGTDYDLTNYYGAPDATEVIIAMGSVMPTARQTVDYLNQHGRKVGCLTIHLYRPFPAAHMLSQLPKTVRRIAVLDRTKEPGAGGEPLLLDVQSAWYGQANAPVIIGGRYGLASKNVAPEQLVAVFDELQRPVSQMHQRFTVGIVDDQTHLSLPLGPALDLTPNAVYQAKFFGFGSDGTVGATKQAADLIGAHTNQAVQAYSEYDSKKSSGLSVSHLRFGGKQIDSTYTVSHPNFVGCHHASYLNRYNMLAGLVDHGTFLLNTYWDAPTTQRLLPAKLKRYIALHHINLYVIDAAKIARQCGLGRRINTVMCTAFFELAGVIPRSEFVPLLQAEATRVYQSKSGVLVAANHQAIAATCDALIRVPVLDDWADDPKVVAPTGEDAGFLETIFKPMIHQHGDAITVKQLADNQMLAGNLPLGSAAFEKRAIAERVPQWDASSCLECNLCAVVCPHAAIRPVLATDEELTEAPEGFIVKEMHGEDGLKYRIQVSVDDCTGCGLCAAVCPANPKALSMQPVASQVDQRLAWTFAQSLKPKTTSIPIDTVRGSQFQPPLLEFSGACAGCGETGYVKLLTQLFGDHLRIANTTGCSSIWGGASPISPYTTDQNGHGPAWSNSLFEDNAEFGLGMHLADTIKRQALIQAVTAALDQGLGSAQTQAALKTWLAGANTSLDTRKRADALIACLREETHPALTALLDQQDQLIKVSQWIIGGDGWAYDIGFGGVDHVLASGADVNLFVFDNEVYANTGGQVSKATPQAAVAKFAAGGKRTAKKDLGLLAATYGNVYVAQVSLDANPNQTIQAIMEAERYPGPSLIIGYTPCILHDLKGGMSQALDEAKAAVASGYWPLYRFDPRKAAVDKPPLLMDSREPDFTQMPEFFKSQGRYARLAASTDAATAESLFDQSMVDAKKRLINLGALNTVKGAPSHD